jgi:hypothetical protein
MKNKSVGFYITLVAAVLSVVACVLYSKVMYTLPVVYGFCAAAAVLAVVAIVVGNKSSLVAGLLPVVNAILMACAGVWGVFLMVNELGYVVSGLDSFDAITSFIVFEAFAVVSMLLNIISSFMKQSKDEV